MKRRTKKIGGKRFRTFAGVLPMPHFGAVGASGFLVFLALCFLLVSALQPQVFSGVRTSTVDVFAPVLNVVTEPLQKAAIFVRDVSGLAEIQAENARLTQENQKLREWYQTALLLEAENKSLRDLMSVKAEQAKTYITARVLSDSSNTYVKTLLVSAGSDDGLQQGQAVISGDGLIGRVVEVGAQASRILLVTDINSRVPVLIEGSRQHAIFSGQNAVDGVLMHLPPESEVKVGARIITSGQGGVFPNGLPVGLVKNVDGGRVLVEPFADFNRLMHVRIIEQIQDPHLVRGGGR